MYVCHSPPATFTFQYSDNIDELISLMDEIQDYIATDRPLLPPESVIIGHPILAKYSEDELWYRAQILSCVHADSTVEVIFVDFGNSESVSLSDVRNVPPKMAVLWKQALTCQLSDGTSTMDDWSDKLLEIFEELTKGSEYLTATVIQTSDDDCPCPVLVSFVETWPDWAQLQTNAVL